MDPENFTDKELREAWRCSAVKLWRMRQAGKLKSFRPGDCGQYLTSAAEKARVEALPPEKAAPRGAVNQKTSKVAP